RWAMLFLLSESGQKTFDVFVLGAAKYFVGSFEDYLAVAKHDKPGIGDAHEVVFGVELDLFVAVGRIFAGECEGIPHAVRDEDPGNALDVTQRNDQLIDLL